MKVFRLLTVVSVVLAPLAVQREAVAKPPVQSVVGSGYVDLIEEFGVAFRVTVAAYEDANGHFRGSKVTNLDLRAVGLGKITFLSEVVCLHVNGNSAWIGAIVTQSTNEDIVPVGTYTITLVRDLGGEGEDIMHEEVFDPSVDCADEPELLETVVAKGNYKVR